MRGSVVALVLCSLVATGRAQTAEQDIGRFERGAATVGIAGLAVTEGALLFGARPHTMARSAAELGLSSLVLDVGVAFLAFGSDQHQTYYEGLGAATIAVSVPSTVDGVWGVSRGRGDRGKAGYIELGFGASELAIEGIAFFAAWIDPVGHVRRAGELTAGALAIPSAALMAHGIYLLVGDSPAVAGVAPTAMVVRAAGPPTLGLGAAGRF